MGSRSGVLWDALAGRPRSSRKAAVASLKDKKITAAMLTFDENVALPLLYVLVRALPLLYFVAH